MPSWCLPETQTGGVLKLKILVAKGVGFKHTPLWIAKNVKNIVGGQNWLKGQSNGQLSIWLVDHVSLTARP